MTLEWEFSFTCSDPKTIVSTLDMNFSAAQEQ